MKSIPRASLLQSLIVAAAIAALAPTSARADAIFDWNIKADEIAAQKQLSPAEQGRALAMLHVAMFEAVNAIAPKYSPYKLSLKAERTTSKEASAAAAGHNVLAKLYPDQKASLDSMLATMLAAISDGEAKAKGIALGQEAAAGIIALRENDGIDGQVAYRPHTTPGAYVPTTTPLFVSTPGITPWVMTSGSQFRPAPPPALTSETWTKDVNEIRELGGNKSTKRTAEQTTIGRFWFLTGPRTFNPIVRQVATSKGLDIVDSARMFALVEMAAADAIIAVFDGKYTHNFWRPVTAVRNADQTGNPATPREAVWTPLGDTPMHPEYPCAHCISSGTVATVLEKLVGSEVAEFSLTSPTAPGVTRKWTKLRDYSDEVSNARIYAGFHYRFSTEVGKDMGKKIGELTIATQLRPMEASALPKP
jgi:hypothetical protein